MWSPACLLVTGPLLEQRHLNWQYGESVSSHWCCVNIILSLCLLIVALPVVTERPTYNMTACIGGLREESMPPRGTMAPSTVPSRAKSLCASLSFPVLGSWFYQKQAHGTYRQCFLLPTRPLSAASMNRLGGQRWHKHIEAFFKTMKQWIPAGQFALRRLKAELRWLFFYFSVTGSH